MPPRCLLDYEERVSSGAATEVHAAPVAFHGFVAMAHDGAASQIPTGCGRDAPRRASAR